MYSLMRMLYAASGEEENSIDQSKWISVQKKTRTFLSENPGHNTGNNLLSHSIVAALPLAIEGLTAVVGMGTGVSPHPWSPE
jgi:hypothetical protein